MTSFDFQRSSSKFIGFQREGQRFTHRVCRIFSGYVVVAVAVAVAVEVEVEVAVEVEVLFVQV